MSNAIGIADCHLNRMDSSLRMLGLCGSLLTSRGIGTKVRPRRGVQGGSKLTALAFRKELVALIIPLRFRSRVAACRVGRVVSSGGRLGKVTSEELVTADVHIRTEALGRDSLHHGTLLDVIYTSGVFRNQLLGGGNTASLL